MCKYKSKVKVILFKVATRWAPSPLEIEMSMRLVLQKAFHHGRILLRGFRPHQEFVDVAKSTILPQGIKFHNGLVGKAPIAAKTEGIQYHVNNVRKLFVDNILNKVTNSLASDLRKRASKQLIFGNSAPFLALVGVSLASGTGIITKEDELDGICWEIRVRIHFKYSNG